MLEGEDVFAAAMGVEAGSGRGVTKAYQWITNKIADAVSKETAEIALELMDDRPEFWSKGGYQWLGKQARLLVRIDGSLQPSEIREVFCREIAEFLQRQTTGGVITQEVWTTWGPQLLRELTSFF